MHQMRSGETHFNIVGRARRWFVISGILVVICIGSLGIKKINPGLEFRGGTAFTVESASRGVSVQDVRDELGKAGLSNETVQKQGTRGFLIETEHLSAREQADATDAIAKILDVKRSEVNITDVGPKWGAQITSKAVRALIIFLIVVVIYLAIRLEPKMSGSAMIALLHDMIITAGIYSLAGLEVTPSTVIALLTILGYSLYDTVVIFDRVKDRTASLSAAGRITYSEAANEALNHVLIRSLNTSMTALLPVGSLLFVGSFLLGAQTLRELALALFIGIAVGTYSSIFVATPALALWKEREPRWSTLRARVAARAPETVSAPRVAPSDPAVAPATAPTTTATATVAAATPPTVQHQPQRPKGQPQRRRKKKKRRR
jgi:preprotein translocase subunit SecF